MEMDEKISKLIDYLETTDMTDEEFVELFNASVDQVGFEDDKIYLMSDFDDILGGYFKFSPSQIVDYVSPQFSLLDRFFTVDMTHEEIVSFNELDDAASPFDMDVIVDAVIDSGEGFGDAGIQSIIDE